MSSSMAVRAPACTSAAARSAGVVDMPAGVDELACRVLAKRAARHILAAAEGGSPDRPVASGAGGVPAPDQQLQVLPDAEHRFARPGQALVPDADPRGARPADDQARQPAPERADHVALLLVPAGARRQQEAAVDGRGACQSMARVIQGLERSVLAWEGAQSRG
jgi:hypothetical protein